MKDYNSKNEWSKVFLKQKEIFYPSEYVIRIFKGKYPNLDFSSKSIKGKKILDIGCGDGRNIVFLDKCGFRTFGMEISEGIIKKLKKKIGELKINCDVREGTNTDIPFENNFFDYALAWNSSYYMGTNKNFQLHVNEYSRIIKKNGFLILSIPKKTCFIYKKSKKLNSGLVKITNDPFKIRNGEILRMFEDEKEIKKVFSSKFFNFVFASIEDDCFGYKYHWHLCVCQKK